MQRVVSVCDLHEELVPAVGRLEYAIDGQRTSLDLCADHLVLVRGSLEALVGDAGTAHTSSGRVPGSRRELSSKRDKVRTWARENGFGVAERGRLSAETLEAYERAHAQPRT